MKHLPLAAHKELIEPPWPLFDPLLNPLYPDPCGLYSELSENDRKALLAERELARKLRGTEQ